MKTIEVKDEVYEGLDDMLCDEVPTVGDAVEGLMKLTDIQARQLSDFRKEMKESKALISVLNRFIEAGVNFSIRRYDGGWHLKIGDIINGFDHDTFGKPCKTVEEVHAWFLDRLETPKAKPR